MERQVGRIEAKNAGLTIDLEAGRRAFIRSLGIGAAGSLFFGATAGDVAAANLPQRREPTELDVLNFALNLEYLEAEFYLRAATGSGLPAHDIGTNPGQVTGGRKVVFEDPLVSAYAREIANDEQLHVEFLRAALGGAAVARPRIDLAKSFTTAARAAGLIGNSQTFDAFADDGSFLLAAYIFEDVGVSAYHGAAGFLAGNLTYLDVAAGILAVEAYHAGLIRTVLFAGKKSRETQLISNLRQSLGPVDSSTASGGKDNGVQTLSQPNVVQADNFAVSFKRTPRNVLNVVYGAQNASKGLFFPQGLNGTIK